MRECIGTTLTDRERILLHVLQGLRFSAILCRHGDPFREETWRDRGDSSMYVHFAKYRKARPGDLVMGDTGGINEWKLAFYVRNEGSGNHVVRDLNTGRLCNYGNEEFTPIVGLAPSQLFCGEQRQFYEKVLRAFAKGDEYMYPFGGLTFDAADEAVIWIREKWGGLGGTSVPFSCRIKFNKRTSVKAILAALRAAGYGWRPFSPGQQVDDFGNLAERRPEVYAGWMA
jgi:hypothetical protein